VRELALDLLHLTSVVAWDWGGLSLRSSPFFTHVIYASHAFLPINCRDAGLNKLAQTSAQEGANAVSKVG
jgi:hypothetical protein